MKSNPFDKKIAIVAPNASARFGGEAILPLHYFTFLRKKNVDVSLIVHERVSEELTDLLGTDISRVTFVRDTKLHQFLNKFSSYMPKRIYEFSIGAVLQIITELSQREILKKLTKENRIDIIHQPTPVSPKMPSLLFGIGPPVVIGPLNGGMSFPPGFANHQNIFERGFMKAGRLFSEVVNHILPGKKHADIVLVANRRTEATLPKCIKGRVIKLVENGVDLNQFSNSSRAATMHNGNFKFVFVGRLVDWKSIDTLIRAMKQFDYGQAELHILGDGEEKQALQTLARELNVEKSVVFHGFLPQNECADLLKTSDCLVLSSLYECGGAVVLEAMAMGLPVIATNWGGPSEYIDSDTGILVDIGKNKVEFDNNFAQAMKHAQVNRDASKEMGRLGREVIKQKYDWNLKIEKIIEIYNTLPQVHMETEEYHPVTESSIEKSRVYES